MAHQKSTIIYRQSSIKKKFQRTEKFGMTHVCARKNEITYACIGLRFGL